METTKALLAQLANALADNYRDALARMPIKKPVREALADGFRAGAHEAARHTAEMLGATIKE